MSDLKYTVIKDEKQYFNYCEVLQQLTFSDNVKKFDDEIALLTLLVKEYDNRDTFFNRSKRDPVAVLRSLMDNNKKSQQDIATLLKVSKGYISEILNYKKRLSSDGIRKLANYFSIQQEALNREYELNPIKKKSKQRPQVILKRSINARIKRSKVSS